jgi:MvdD-like protein with pre-ATP grasp domain/ribosomal protein S6-L-glutamate ligase RimK-like protein
MSDRWVLIVSTAVDTATDEVVKRLSGLAVPHFRINTEDYPFSGNLTLRLGVQEQGPWMQFGDSAFLKPSSIWYRRMRISNAPEGMDPGIYEYCLRENRAALLGSIMTSAPRWMSEPAAVWRAEHKPYQLALAEQAGLRIPKTVITNQPSEVDRAFKTFGSLVVKPVRSGHVVHAGEERAIFTSRVLEEHLSAVDDAKWCPAIYQELIPKRFDIRVTIVGNTVFTAAIDSQSDPDARVDWRQTSNPQLPHRRMSLPDDLQRRLLGLMRQMDLQFAGIDLVLTPEGEYVFLEVNPSGQWLWLDDMLGFGISDAVTQWLSIEGHD